MRTATVDTETDGLLPDVTKVWCAVVKDMDSGILTSYTPDNIHLLCDSLDTFDCIRGHNLIAFDLAVLRKLYGYKYHGTIEDTLLISRLQRPNRKVPPTCKGRGPHSVEAWGIRLGRSKPEHEDWTRFSPEMLYRCKEDVEIQCLIYDALMEEGAGEGWTKAHLLNNKLFTLLQRQAEYGFMVNKEKLDESLQLLERWINKIDKTVRPSLPLLRIIDELKKDGEYNYVKKPFLKNGGYSRSSLAWLENDRYESEIVGPFSRISYRRVDLDKNLEVKEFLLRLGWEPDQWNTNNEGERTSPKLSKDDSFHGIQGGLGKLVTKRIQCKQRRGIIQGWKENIREDGRIAAEITGLAITGRARHRGIVNVPGAEAFFGKIMRSLFVAKPGWVLVGIDSVGNQARQLAARMGDDAFSASVLDPSKDVHTETQRRCDLLSRHIAKTFFYGLIFGSGDAKAGRIVGGTAADGKRLKEQVFKSIPALKECIDRLTNEWRKSAKKWYNKKYGRMEYRDGYIRGLDGRPIQVDSEHKVLVYTLQSDEAIQMSAAYCIFHKWLDQEGYEYGRDYGMTLWMHDEFQVECRPEMADRVGELGCKAITWAGEYFKIPVIHEGEYKIGRHWGITH